MADYSDIPTETLAESENFVLWVSEEPDGEVVYHVDLGAVTLHFFQEEFDELIKLIKSVKPR
ncbi:MAG: hypothetical protein JXN59_14975 [Anaerolineae bacterium]|nr:hypothetical protein [Anaerolineae bacterium]